MSSKVKMRCAHCGKTFKSSAKHTLCPDCEAKERRARAAARTAPVKPAGAAPVLVSAPKIVGPGAGMLVPGTAPQLTPMPVLERSLREQSPVAGVRVAQPLQEHEGGELPRTGQPGEGKGLGRDGHAQHERQQKSKHPRPPREPKPRREPTPPFILSDELRTTIEARYLELAQPVEFDGIRTQIATELDIPKTAVKKAVLELRQRMQMPSWWELQAYKGSDEDLERIRQAYVGYLPVPPVGIHKEVAADLGLEPLTVYQGIRRIRAEMHLPQYNPPELHEHAGGSVESAEGADGEPAQTPASLTSSTAEA